MKQNLHFQKIMRSVLFGTAMAAAACTFTACDNEGIDPVATQAVSQDDTENGALIPGQYIVVFSQGGNLRMDANATYAQRVEAVRQTGSNILSENSIQGATIEQAYGKAITGMAVRISAAEAAKLATDPRVAYVEQDRIVALGKPGGGGTSSPGETIPAGITRVGGGTTASTATAWIIDTGIDLDHPDLNVDVNRSRTFFTNGRDADSPDDGNGHGSHVAGTIAAKDNDIGVVGVAPGTTVVAVKVLDSRGSGAYSTVIAGVDYVAANAKSGDVANMSLGGPISTALDDAIIAAANKGVKFALAAGNESEDANNSSPAHVNHANVYTVSAVDAGDKFAYFSNFGNPPVDFAAPGVSILSTWKGGAYNTISGTSMASPHVAGLLLLGAVNSSGTAIGDPDGNPDPIAHH
ncbi:S8 family serine peptidase [Pontibacter sp. 172403-2]|uniref:S8 family serine peptidase n=1 Tax=Pontibacter rufus TaxID=2791028 RepID=UPI0018AFF713|nr:S8 family serine peptidase [Pontibacter sp. 172403-2]MBF9253988.1 S8 family serine peptidase [Pontibacter sp. 172403-2]